MSIIALHPSELAGYFADYLADRTVIDSIRLDAYDPHTDDVDATLEVAAVTSAGRGPAIEVAGLALSIRDAERLADALRRLAGIFEERA